MATTTEEIAELLKPVGDVLTEEPTGAGTMVILNNGAVLQLLGDGDWQVIKGTSDCLAPHSPVHSWHGCMIGSAPRLAIEPLDAIDLADTETLKRLLADANASIASLAERLQSANAQTQAAHHERGALERRVSTTAMRLAREHDWCDVVKTALEEMGIPIIEERVKALVTLTFEVTAIPSDRPAHEVSDSWFDASLIVDHDELERAISLDGSFDSDGFSVAYQSHNAEILDVIA